MKTIGAYEIDIFRDETFRKDSVDNVHGYDQVYIDDGDYLPNTIFGIKVYKEGQLVSSAVIGSAGGGTGIFEYSVIYEDTRIVVCCSGTIFCLSVPDLALLWQTIADTATCFQIFLYQDSYIVHGEMEITRLDKNGQILWQRSGADIFVSPDGSENFGLTDTHIWAYDFEDNGYRFDYNGKDFIY